MAWTFSSAKAELLRLASTDLVVSTLVEDPDLDCGFEARVATRIRTLADLFQELEDRLLLDDEDEYLELPENRNFLLKLASKVAVGLPGLTELNAESPSPVGASATEGAEDAIDEWDDDDKRAIKLVATEFGKKYENDIKYLFTNLGYCVAKDAVSECRIEPHEMDEWFHNPNLSREEIVVKGLETFLRRLHRENVTAVDLKNVIAKLVTDKKFFPQPLEMLKRSLLGDKSGDSV